MMRLTTIGIALCLGACVDPFFIPIHEGNQMVVEALITDQPGPYQVRLYAGNLNDPLPISGAQIRILDQNAQSVSFLETQPGLYRSFPQSSFRGQVGNSYTLEIITSEGARYCSRPEIMVPVPDVAQIEVQQAQQVSVSDQGNEVSIDGFQVLVTPDSNPGQGTYLRWDYRGVYAIKTPDPCDECPKICWFADRPPTEYLRILGTPQPDAQMPTVALEFFLPIMEFDTAYIMNIKQYSLNARAFEFWDAVKAQREQTGTIFDPPPGEIQGNIFNCDNPNELVLGYFGASAVQEIEFPIFKEDLTSFNLNFEFPLLECFRPEPGPRYCTDCLLLEGSNPEIPQVVW